MFSHQYVVTGLKIVSCAHITIYDSAGTNTTIPADAKWSAIFSIAETQYATWLKLAVVARLYKVIFHNLPQLVIRRNS
jgi:hypothetical protein